MVRPNVGESVGDEAASSEWRITLFGGITCVRGPKSVSRFDTRQAMLLLARLALSPGKPFYREELADLLWPLDPVDASLPRLRQALWSVRKALGDEDLIEADRATIRLVAERVRTDVQSLEAVLRPGTSSDRLACGLALYGGPLMGGLQEDWLLPLRHGYSQAFVKGCVRLGGLLADEGQADEAVEWANRASDEDPLSEEAHALAIRLLADQGRLDQALQRYRTYAAALREALDISPNSALRSMVAELQERSVGQVGLREIAHSPTSFGIKHPITRFFGREPEIGLLSAWCDEATGGRLLTLVAPGGFGKTRLAAEIAARASQKAGRMVVFIDLVDVADGDRLTGAIAEQVAPGPDRGLSPLERLDVAIGKRPAILVLDNFEHLLDRGPGQVLALLEKLPRLRCLVTSRVKLGLPGELAVPLLPLPVEDDGGSLAPGVEMFLDRMSLVQGGVPAATREQAKAICQTLEGIPLAIELAAAQSTLLSAAEVLDQLRDRLRVLELANETGPARQRTLGDAIAWSYSILDEDTQRFMRQLTVFRGGCTLASAESVTGEKRAARMLDSLCGLALIVPDRRPEGTRFRMLETVREFLLGESPGEEQAAMRSSLRSWLTTVIASGFAAMASPELGTHWFEEIEEERENIRGALAEALGEDIGWGLRAVSMLGRFWAERGYLNEGKHWLNLYLQRSDVPEGRDQWLALFRLANILRHEGDGEGTLEVLHRSRAIAERLGSQRFSGAIVMNLAGAMMYLGHIREAHNTALKAVEILRNVRSPDDEILSQGFAAFTLIALGEFERGIALAEENVRFSRRYRDPWNQAVSKLNLGWGLSLAGRSEEARILLQQGINEFKEHGFRTLILERIHLLIEHYLDVGDLAMADEAITECAELAIEIEDAGRAVQALYYRGELLLRVGEPDAAVRAFIGAIEGQRHPAKTMTLLCLDGLAGCALAKGNAQLAVRLSSSVEELREQLDIQAIPNAQRRHDARKRQAIEIAGEAGAAAGCPTLDDAVRLARELRD